MTPPPPDAFNNASAYDGYVGRWSRLVAHPFVAWLNTFPGWRWLDVGAGTGILTQVILEQASPQNIVAIDSSDGFIARARERVSDNRVAFFVGDAQQLDFDAPEFDAAVAGLVLNFLPSPARAVHSMRDVVLPGGLVAAYVWDYGDRMEMMRHFWDAAAVVDPASLAFDSGSRFALCSPQPLRDLFESAGLDDVDVTAIDIATRFANIDDFWLPFLSAQGSVSRYLSAQDEPMRQRIREQLLHQLPINPDDSIDLTARAWAVKGMR